MSDRYHLTTEYIRQCFEYRDGKLFWLMRPLEHFPNARTCGMWNKRFPGTESGHSRKYPNRTTVSYYRVIYLNGIARLRSNLVWLFHGRELPPMIDHKNRQTLDDRIENLRPATYSQNASNRKVRITSRSGIKGVSRSYGKWKAVIQVNGHRFHLGTFPDAEQARVAYYEAAQKLHGEFACNGEPVK